ncbi:MAG TPA: DinB family protein [Pirellulales bacterium]|nr:DinB family protein [Pirellulales bacterium]
MNLHELIKYSIDMTAQICMQSIDDLSDGELFHRPDPACNHINWQLGHLIVAEYGLIAKEFPKALPELPAGFADRYTKETAKLDDPKAFATKAQLLEVHHKQRAAVLAALEKTSEAELGRKLEGWTPTVAALFDAAAGAHWMMHVGQWAVVRRQLGRPPMF